MSLCVLRFIGIVVLFTNNLLYCNFSNFKLKTLLSENVYTVSVLKLPEVATATCLDSYVELVTFGLEFIVMVFTQDCQKQKY